MRLRLLGDEPVEGVAFLVKILGAGDASLSMPMRSPTVTDGILDVGGVAPGPFTLLGTEHGPTGFGATQLLTFEVESHLAPGALTLHFTLEGYAPASVDVVARAAEIQDLIVRMLPM